MGTLLVLNATVLATMDGPLGDIRRGGMFVRDGWIERVGLEPDLPRDADEVVDLDGCVVFPGLVNAHHHLFQTLDRACPDCQGGGLEAWLRALYPRWKKLTPDAVRLATEIGLAELALSGCTTVADHHYLWPNGNVAEDQLEVAARVGLRFHLGRGFQTLGEADGGFAPASLTETGATVLADCERVVSAHHEAAPGAMVRVYVAPSSVRSVDPDLLTRAADLARDFGVGFHMHLGETTGEVDFVRERFGCRPAELVERLGCVGDNTWFAHGVHFDDADCSILRRHGCGICHCPSSNMILGSGMAPVRRYLDAGLAVGLGVDGAASNDSSNLLAEVRLALLVARVGAPAGSEPMTGRDALALATSGGARLLGRDDIGRLAPGCVADFAAVRLDRAGMLGAVDPVAALAHCVVGGVDESWVHGRRIVAGRTLPHVDLARLSRQAMATSAPSA